MKIGVIGCGASGIMAAISASRNGHNVTILEHTSKIGKKILVTGNGKCNFTNAVISASNYNKSASVLFESVYAYFKNDDMVEFLDSIGVSATQKNGYYYPRSEQASSIVDALGYALYKANVKVIKDCNIESVVNNKTDYSAFIKAIREDDSDINVDGGFKVITDRGDFDFDKLIIATGSKAAMKTGSDGSGYEIAKSLGHRIIEPLPALCGLKCDGNWFSKVSGVRCPAKVKLFIGDTLVKEDSGELQLTEYGVSGIPVFQISADAVRAYEEGKEVILVIDFYEEKEIDDFIDLIHNVILKTPEKSADEFLSGIFNRKLCQAFMDICGIDRTAKCASLMEEEICELAEVIKSMEVNIIGYNEDNAQICSGGISCNELKSSLESRICKGLYFAGEIIDINGDCGGYNLQWAWSSGYVAGLLG